MFASGFRRAHYQGRLNAMNANHCIREPVLTCRPRVPGGRDTLTIASTNVGNVALSFPMTQRLTRNDPAKGARGAGRDVHLKLILQFQRNSLACSSFTNTTLCMLGIGSSARETGSDSQLARLYLWMDLRKPVSWMCCDEHLTSSSEVRVASVNEDHRARRDPIARSSSLSGQS